MPNSAKSQSHQSYQAMENTTTEKLCNLCGKIGHKCMKKEILEGEELEVAERDEDKPEVRVDFKQDEPYQWVMKSAMKSQEMVTLSDDIGEVSIYAAGEQVFKSHLYSALGAALYLGRNMILWIDYPLAVLKKFCEKEKAARIYWDEGTKDRSYSYLKYEGHHFGLSPSVQELKFLKDDFLGEIGLNLKTRRFGFQCQDWDKDVKYLEMDIKEVNKEPTKSKLMKYLEMEEEDLKADEIIQEIRKKNEEKNRMKRE